jgi:hypothetical protein
MLESQEGERFRFSLATLGPAERRKPPESDQPCLVFIPLQPILAQMLLPFPEVTLRLVLALEAEDGIVGAAYDGDLATRRLPPLIPPLPLDRHIQRIQRHMLPASRPEPIREPPKILFVYRVEDRDHGLLDDLILQCRDPQWPLLAIGFRYPASLGWLRLIRAAVHPAV